MAVQKSKSKRNKFFISTLILSILSFLWLIEYSGEEINNDINDSLDNKPQAKKIGRASCRERV